MRIVKRYANRKLYDTRDSSYVTLQQIADFVREGDDVRIIDNRTKEDLTDVTLAQIIYEEQKDGNRSTWSIETLRELVREGGDRLMSSIKESPQKLMDRPKGALEELSRLKDERVLSLVHTAKGQLESLEAEVLRLKARVEELEGKLASRRGKGE